MANQAHAFNHIIAVDVGKTELEVFILPGERRCTIPNKPKAIKALLNRERRRNQAEQLGPMLLVCEPTGGYEQKLLQLAWDQDMVCLRACGRRVRAFARAMGRFAKTDKIDAELLARFAQKADKLMLWAPPSPAQQCLIQLVARRTDLLDMLLAEKNRQEHPGTARVRQSQNRLIALIKAELKDIEAEINATIKQDPELAHKARLLASFKGVGPVTIATLLAYMPELGSLSKSQVAALAGLAPYNDDSAQSNRPRHIKAGRAQVRKCLYMVATVASRHNPVLKAVFQRLRNNAKDYKVALTALMRKIIVILNAMLKQQQPWKHAQNA